MFAAGSPLGRKTAKTRNKFGTGRSCVLLSPGFTMIELMIVLAIMGFVIAFAGPRISKGLSSLSLKTTAKKITGLLRYARSKAVNTGRTYNVIFDSEKNRVIVMRLSGAPTSGLMNQDSATDDEDNTEQPVSQDTDQEIKIYPLPDGIFFNKITIAETDFEQEEENGIYQMAFFPNGTSHGLEAVLADPRERMFLVSVDFITGVVSLEEQTEE